MDGMFSSFRARLISILIVINVCVLALGAASYFLLGQVGQKLDEFSGGIYHRLEITNRMRVAAEDRAIAVRNLALITDPKQQAESIQIFERQQKTTADALAELQDAVRRPEIPAEVQEKVAAIANVEAKYSPVAASIVAQLKAGDREAAVQRIAEQCNPTLAQLNDAIHAYTSLTESRTKAFVQAADSSSDVQRQFLLGFAMVSIALVGTMGYLLRKNVFHTLGTDPEALRVMIGRMADGDLATSTNSDQSHPNSVLAALGRMRLSMGSIVGQVRQASDSIATGSSEIASGNADLSMRTEDQASNLQHASASMVGIRSMVERNADTASQAAGLASSASAAAQNGGEVMRQVVDTMQDIATSSQKVTDIIAVIDGIAFQTNILALNAAVEAARAGEQGRGFAVVAGEVRALAQRSANAAREIKSLIGSSTEKVDTGKQLVHNAGSSIDDIVSQVGKVAHFIEEISASAMEQKAAIAEVSDSVTNLDQVTQQNAALVEESAAAAESLKHQASKLATLVNQFQVAGIEASAQNHQPAPIAAQKASTARPAVKAHNSVKVNQAPKSMPAPRPAPVAAASATVTPAAAPVDDNDWATF